jgi:uncharacterized membrane protein YjdF
MTGEGTGFAGFSCMSAELSEVDGALGATGMPADCNPQAMGKVLAVIGVVCSVAIVVIAATAKVATYHVNPIFLIPLAWLPFWLRRPIHLHPLHYAMFCLAILFHDLGAYGFYQHSPFPWSFDIYVHYYFAIPVTLMLYRAIATNFPELRGWQAGMTSLLFMMGVGALHEIMEYMTYLLLGEEKGMLKPSTSYFFDTQRDLTNNLLGTMTALALVSLYYFAQRRSSFNPSLPVASSEPSSTNPISPCREG